MTPAERDELNTAVARLDGWLCSSSDKWFHPKQVFDLAKDAPPDYFGDPRLWAPILERLCKAGYWLEHYDNKYRIISFDKPDRPRSSNTLAEAVMRLFVALRGEV